MKYVWRILLVIMIIFTALWTLLTMVAISGNIIIPFFVIIEIIVVFILVSVYRKCQFKNSKQPLSQKQDEIIAPVMPDPEPITEKTEEILPAEAEQPVQDIEETNEAVEETSEDVPVEKEPKQAPKKKYTHVNVVGTSFRKNTIIDLLSENMFYTSTKKELIEYCMYDEPIYKYDAESYMANLVEEPDNEYDPNAIKVEVLDECVGYIPKTKTASVKKLIDSGKILNVVADISGGDYKILHEEFDDEKLKDVYKTKTYKSDFHIELIIETEK